MLGEEWATRKYDVPEYRFYEFLGAQSLGMYAPSAGPFVGELEQHTACTGDIPVVEVLSDASAENLPYNVPMDRCTDCNDCGLWKYVLGVR